MESYLDVQHLTKSFGEKVLFDDMSFSVSEGQKVGLVARNGTGKSTLLSILHGDEGYDAGQIVYRNDIRVGYLEQTPHFNPTDTVLDACFNHEGNPEKVLRAKQVLTQLRIEDLEQKVGEDVSLKAGFDPAAREIVFRVFSADNEWFEGGRTVHEFETVMQRDGKRIFVERLCQQGKVVDEVTPRTVIRPGDQLVVSGRREYVISEEKWIGAEVSDTTLTNFAVQVLPVVVNRKGAAGERIGKVLSAKFMHGVNIRSIVRAGVKIPVRSGAKLDAGDRIELVGLPQDVRRAAAQLGFSDPVKTESSVPLLGLGICLGGLIFGWMLVAKIGAIPLSLTVSGGVLLAGLFCGWARSRRPTLGGIPEQTVWFMNNMGLNTFIAIVGISTGPSFVAGFQQVGWSLFLVGAGATTLPLVLGVLIGRYLFRFNDALTLGCVAGARTTTAALGAVEDTIGSNVPSLGYTITYAIGNTLLIIWGVVLVLLLA